MAADSPAEQAAGAVGKRIGRFGGNRRNGVSFERPLAFWIAMLLVVAGVCLQLPMYYMARHDHYMVAGMAVTPSMVVGMVMIIAGIGLTAFSLFPPGGRVEAPPSRIRIAALDDAPIRPAHILLLLTLAIAITIDVMKVTTLGFIAPGAAAEYGLKGPLNPHAHALSIGLYPLAGISGTTIGSFLWGLLGDRVGRAAPSCCRV